METKMYDLFTVVIVGVVAFAIGFIFKNPILKGVRYISNRFAQKIEAQKKVTNKVTKK